MPLIAAYVILCVICGVLGRHKTVGFWGYLILSIVVTPVISIAVLVLGMDREIREIQVKA